MGVHFVTVSCAHDPLYSSASLACHIVKGMNDAQPLHKIMNGWPSILLPFIKTLSCSCVRLSCSMLWVRSWPGHTKDHHKIGTNCIPAWHAGIRVGVSKKHSNEFIN